MADKKKQQAALSAVPVGSVVEFDPTGKGENITGEVIASSGKKIKVQPKDGSEPVTVSPKSVTIIKKGKGAPKAKKEGNGESKSITAGADLSHYKKNTEVKTAGGRPSFDIGDETASLLRGKSFPEQVKITVRKIKELTGEAPAEKDLLEKYGKLNPGQQRMNLGNRLRAAFKADKAE